MVKGAVDLDDIRARLRATMNLITRHRIDAITRGDPSPPSVPMTPWMLSGTGWRRCCTDRKDSGPRCRTRDTGERSSTTRTWLSQPGMAFEAVSAHVARLSAVRRLHFSRRCRLNGVAGTLTPGIERGKAGGR